MNLTIVHKHWLAMPSLTEDVKTWLTPSTVETSWLLINDKYITTCDSLTIYTKSTPANQRCWMSLTLPSSVSGTNKNWIYWMTAYQKYQVHQVEPRLPTTHRVITRNLPERTHQKQQPWDEDNTFYKTLYIILPNKYKK